MSKLVQVLLKDELFQRFEAQRFRAGRDGQLLMHTGFVRICAKLGLILLEQEKELTPKVFLALLAMADPPLPDKRAVVGQLKNKGLTKGV